MKRSEARRGMEVAYHVTKHSLHWGTITKVETRQPKSHWGHGPRPSVTFLTVQLEGGREITDRIAKFEIRDRTEYERRQDEAKQRRLDETARRLARQMDLDALATRFNKVMNMRVERTGDGVKPFQLTPSEFEAIVCNLELLEVMQGE